MLAVRATDLVVHGRLRCVLFGNHHGAECHPLPTYSSPWLKKSAVPNATGGSASKAGGDQREVSKAPIHFFARV